MMPQNKVGLDLLVKLEVNPDTHKLCSEFISKPIDCKFIKKANGNFMLSFELNDDLFVNGASSDSFFEKPILINAFSHLIVIYNYNVEELRTHFSSETPKYEIDIREFRAYSNGVEDYWMNGKHSAFVKYNKKQFEAHKIGVVFDIEEPNGLLPNNALRIQVKDVDLIFSYESINDEYGGLFFLSQDNTSFESFQKIIDSVLVACGLITGCYIKDNIFFVSATTGKEKQISFSYININQGIYHKYPLIASGHYKELSKDEYNFSSIQFNSLVNILHCNEEYLRSALLLVSAGYLNGCAKASNGAVALETISGIIAKKEGGKTIIADKNCSRKVIYKLRKTLKKFRENIDKSGFDIINQRLSQINNDTNIAKLENAFLDNSIILSNSELFALKCRNFILHGSLPKNKEYNVLSETELLEMVAHRLIMLSGMLLFKLANYNKNIIDWGMTELIKKRHIM